MSRAQKRPGGQRPFLWSLAALVLGGCVTLGPDYSRPSPTPAQAGAAGEEGLVDSWHETSPTVTAPATTGGERWWSAFGDPSLDLLVERALAGNLDLQIAAARLEEAHALAGRARAERMPSIGVDGAVSRDDSISGFGGLAGDDRATLRGERRALSATVDFEVDLLGRLRRSEEAARAELLASAANLRAVELGVVAEVARLWFERTSLAQERQLFEAGLARRREAVELLDQRFAAGVIAGADLDRANAELAATEATLPQIELAERRAEHRLAVLLGRAPVAAGIVPPEGPLVAPPAIPAGLPSTLLDRRPDLIAAEQQLAAATARIGVAKAEIFPRLSLTGAYGRESLELGSFVSASSAVWNLGANLIGSIVGFGRGRARVEAAEARALQAVASWRLAVLEAFGEVEDALVARRTQGERAEALERRAAALERATRAEQLRYESGEGSYFESLDAERNLLAAQAEAIAARRAALIASVDLVQALGGGWADPEHQRALTADTSLAK